MFPLSTCHIQMARVTTPHLPPTAPVGKEVRLELGGCSSRFCAEGSQGSGPQQLSMTRGIWEGIPEVVGLTIVMKSQQAEGGALA